MAYRAALSRQGACMLVAMLLTVSGACASPAPPTITIDKALGRVAGWSIGYSKSMNGCLAAATYQDGTTVWFGLTQSRDVAYLAFSNPHWQTIEVGQTYQLQMRARGAGNWHGDFVGFQVNGAKGLFQSALKESFVSDLSAAGGLSVIFRGKPIASLSLVGSTDALQAAMECQKGVMEAKSEPDENRKPAERTQISAPDKAGDKSSQGTGFFVTPQGHVLTNDHVIDGCTDITITQVGREAQKAVLIAKDETNDLAVLGTTVKPEAVPPLSMRARVGQTVFAYGYPLNGLLATTGNFTIGNVTATAGMGDDTRDLQISAPVQPGNSGGPLVDQYGNVVGVIQAKLDAMKMASAISDVPQNVNFAIKATVALNFLEANNLAASIEAKTTDAMDGEAIAEKAKAFTVRVNCH